MDPDRSASGCFAVGMLPREGEALLASQLCGNDELDMRQRAIINFDQVVSAAVMKYSHTPTVAQWDPSSPIPLIYLGRCSSEFAVAMADYL